MRMTCPHIHLITLWFLVVAYVRMWKAEQSMQLIAFCGLCFLFAAFKKNKGTWGEFLQCSCFLNCFGTTSPRSDVRVQNFLYSFALMDYWLWGEWECSNASFPTSKTWKLELVFIVSPLEFTKSTFKWTIWQYSSFLLKKKISLV